MSNEWLHACTRGGTRVFPYGSTYQPQACIGGDRGTTGLVDVGTLTCNGGFDGIYDLSGNAHEWMDYCGPPGDGGLPETASCIFTQGGWHSSPEELGCAAFNFNAARGFRESDIGFRCCSD